MNGSSKNGGGFLSFNKFPPRLYITAEDDEFDQQILHHSVEEGYRVIYLPMKGGGKPYVAILKQLADDLDLGETYAIIAFGTAATICLEIATKPMSRCAAVICYYPTLIPNPNANYPSQLNLVVHLAASQPFAPKFSYYKYSNVEPGFAEPDLDTYNRVAAGLAWTRSLAALRKGFKITIDLEEAYENFAALSLGNNHANAANAANAAINPNGCVNYTPTCTGGIGYRALYCFYHDLFIPGIPLSMSTTLVSRTVGVNRIVDEMVLSFKHTQEMPWILPGVPPTNKEVKIAVVSIIAVRGGKLVSEHVYWDQASVLVQIGALDPKVIPKALEEQGCKRLPVIGGDAAKKVLDVDSIPSNTLIEK